MNMPMCTALPLSRRATAVVAKARLRFPAHAVEEDGVKRRLQLVLAVIGGLILVDVAIAFVFNERLVGNLREELSLTDQVARAIASLMMVSVVSGAVFLWHLGFHRGLHRGMRVTSLVVGTALGVGAVLVAAAVALPTFRDLFSALLLGAPPIPTAIAVSEAQSEPVPLWARVMTAAPLVGIGALVGALGLIALTLHDQLGAIRQRLVRMQKFVSIADAALAARQRECALQAECAAHAVLLVKQAEVLSLVIAAINIYLEVLAAARPQPIELAQQSAAAHEFVLSQAQRLAYCEGVAREFLRDDRVVGLVRRQMQENDSPVNAK